MTKESENVSFENARGDRLAGVLELPEAPPRAFALFAHCFSCSKDIRAAREIARSLCAEGVAALRFDFAGLGMSEGEFADTNFSSNVDDLVAAADFLRAEYSAPALLVGHSLGGAAALAAVARIEEVRAVATIGAPASAAHVADHFGDKRSEIVTEGEAEVSLAGRPFIIRRQFLEDIERADVLGAASRLARPLVIMHAPLDQTVGIENAGRIFAAARHPKSFISLDKGDHLLTGAGDAPYAARVLAAWASRYIVSN
ncbi:MAG: alpha/beta fold hydrolase [Parvularculaceae bacterium]